MRQGPPKKKQSGTSLGNQIIARLTDLAETLERDEPIAPPRFTARTVELPNVPAGYDAAAAKTNRQE